MSKDEAPDFRNVRLRTCMKCAHETKAGHWYCKLHDFYFEFLPADYVCNDFTPREQKATAL